MPKNADIIFFHIILRYKVPPQDVATGEALDAFATLWQDKMADVWYRFYGRDGTSTPKNTRAVPAEETKHPPTLMKWTINEAIHVTEEVKCQTCKMMRGKIMPAFLGMQPPGVCTHSLPGFLRITQNGTSWQAPLSTKFISGVFENSLNTHNPISLLGYPRRTHPESAG